MDALAQVQADYEAYLAQCQKKNIIPNPETTESVKRIIKLLTPVSGEAHAQK